MTAIIILLGLILLCMFKPVRIFIGILFVHDAAVPCCGC